MQIKYTVHKYGNEAKKPTFLQQLKYIGLFRNQ